MNVQQTKNYYKVLGLEKGCTKPAIKQAYKELSKKYHPDKNNGETLDKFLEIREAYDVLNNEKTREAYDNGFIVIRPATKEEMYMQLASLFDELLEKHLLSPDLDFLDLRKGMLNVLTNIIGKINAAQELAKSRLEPLKKVAKRIRRNDEEVNLFANVAEGKIKELSQHLAELDAKLKFMLDCKTEVEMYEMETMVKTWQTYQTGQYTVSSSNSTSGGSIRITYTQ